MFALQGSAGHHQGSVSISIITLFSEYWSTRAKIHIYSLQTAVALSSFEIDGIFTRNIQDGSAYIIKSIIGNRGGGKDGDFQPKTNLRRGNGFRHILCSCSHLSIIVIA